MGISSSSGSGYSSSDYNLLARLISAEARGEPYVGQVAVGAVVLNRVSHPSFPNTISGVIYQSGAFSCLNDGQFWKEVSDSSYRAARDALNGWDPSGGAIYYYNPTTAKSNWIRSRPIIYRVGKHVFCTWFEKYIVLFFDHILWQKGALLIYLPQISWFCVLWFSTLFFAIVL